MARRRDPNRHPAATPGAATDGETRSKGHLSVVPDLPPVLPTLVPGDNEVEVDPLDVLEMSLPSDTLRWPRDNNIPLQDVYDGKVPGLDPEQIVTDAMDATGSYDGPWTPFP